MTLAYTLGNPEGYEPALDAATPNDPVLKDIGGVVYLSMFRAQEVLDAFDGHLPPSWFSAGRRIGTIPGRVYGLVLPGPPCLVTERKRYGLGLRVPAPVHRLLLHPTEHLLFINRLIKPPFLLKETQSWE